MPERPIILCGLGKVGKGVLQYLLRCGAPVTVVDWSDAAVRGADLGGGRVVIGDWRRAETLEQAGVADARAVIVVTSDDLTNISAAFSVRRANPRVRLVVRLFQQRLIKRLAPALPGAVALSASALTAPLFALSAAAGETLGAFGMEDGPRHVVETLVAPGSPLAGLSLREVESARSCVPLMLRPADGSAAQSLLKLDGSRTLAAGDRLTVCAPGAAAAGLVRRTPAVPRSPGLWRTLRGLVRGIDEFRRSALPSCLLMAVVVALAASVFHFGWGQPPIDALYLTVATLAGNGPDGPPSEIPDWVKLYVTAVRMVGFGLLGWFLAVVMNFLLGTKLRHAFESGRLPDGGHMVVCGLGGLGIRVTEALLDAGEAVAVIERDVDDRFLAAARSRGVPVFIGDATLPEMLAEVRAAQAKCVLALTNDDLVNLEIALLTHEQNPALPVVARMTDPQLAQTLHDAEGVGLTFSVAGLAAPAFASAAFDERVRCVFSAGGEVFMAAELLAEADEPFMLNRTVAELSAEHDLVALSLKTAAGQVLGRPALAGHCIAVGDRLTVVLRPGGLYRLQRIEPRR